MSSKTVTVGQTSVPVRSGAKALITTADRVLLVKERHSDGTPFWTLPGGGVEPTESREQALHRELAEELRCQATIEKRVTQFWYSHVSVDKLSLCAVFECLLLSSVSPNPGEGILDRRWVHPDELPASTLLQVRHLVESRSS